jgi:hypothetical protein
MITDWTEEPDETVLTRTRMQFATGAAVPVSGSRWFRDTERNEIQRDLPAWPEGPEYTLHTPGQKAARRGGRFLRIGVPALIGAAIEALGGTGSGINPTTLGQPTERENEVDDFPVMWAAPDAIARTIPWQLDPARRPKDHTAHAVLTDRRLVLLLQGPDEFDEPEELFSIPRELIARAEQMNFSYEKRDARIWFRDESWVRVSTLDTSVLVRYLTPPLALLGADELTSAQREGLAKWLEGWPPCDESPVITRLPSGIVMVQQRVPGSKSGYGYLAQWYTMNAEGEPAYDPSDTL